MKGAVINLEVFQIANRMGIETLQIQVALQSAPLLAGEKISNLIIVNSCYANSMIELFQGTEISFFILSYTEEKVIFLLYQKEELNAYLKQKEVKNFLIKAGYHTTELEKILTTVSEKYKNYLTGTACFPHELGVLLGYPIEDVCGFIRNNGKKFLYTGYWKVYYHLSDKLKIFERFRQAETAVMDMISNGSNIPDIINFYHNKNVEI